MLTLQRMCYFFGTIRPRRIFNEANYMKNTNYIRKDKRFYHSDEPTEPFENLPFKVNSRYTLTLVFSFLFGTGLWAPFLIVWYSMAKRTM